MAEMLKFDMEYNSQKEHLLIPEYGRNVQNLIRHAQDIENPDMRQAFVEKVVDLIMQMHPQSKNIEDYRDRVWNHLFRIANYKLEVTPPNGIIPKEEDARKKPEHVGYPTSESRFRHYGHNVMTLIDKAVNMEDGPIKDGFVEAIGSYMKLAYRTWNNEHYVSDEIIINDLESLSDGRLTIAGETSLDNLGLQQPQQQQQQRSKGQRKGNKHSGKQGHKNGNNNNNKMRKRKRK